MGYAMLGMDKIDQALRVIIVEANPSYAATLREVVRSVSGCKVTAVLATADEALDTIGCEPPDVLITDVLPAGSLSGFALMWQVTQRYDCHIVGLLQVDDDAYRDGATKHGACACLLKECVAEELPSLLRSLQSSDPK